MLFLLTGDVQIGKTRWLCATCEALEARGVRVAGVVAPGVWREREPGEPSGRHGLDGDGRFEKLGIDNVLLPGGERVPFARRRDLVSERDVWGSGREALAARLGWAISDAAIAQVNAHFARLAAHGAEGRAAPAASLGGLLVVDELGRLELMRGGGLTEAVSMLDAGPTAAYPHALAVVRDVLEPLACQRFERAWGVPCAIGPNAAGGAALAAAFGLDALDEARRL